MLDALNMGRSAPRTLLLSRRRLMRRLRLASCCRILAFTRNPFLFWGVMSGYSLNTAETTRDFEFFKKFHPASSGGLACLGINGESGRHAFAARAGPWLYLFPVVGRE